MFKTIYVPRFSRKLPIFVLALYSTHLDVSFTEKNDGHHGFHGEGLKVVKIYRLRTFM